MGTRCQQCTAKCIMVLDAESIYLHCYSDRHEPVKSVVCVNKGQINKTKMKIPNYGLFSFHFSQSSMFYIDRGGAFLLLRDTVRCHKS